MLPKSNVAFRKFHLQQLVINTVRFLHCSHDAHENSQETRRSTKERIRREYGGEGKKWNEWSINLFLCRYCVAFNLSLFLAFLFVCLLCLFWLQRKSIEYVDWRQNGSLAEASINFSESARLDSSVADKISARDRLFQFLFIFIAAGISDTMLTSRYLIALFSLRSLLKRIRLWNKKIMWKLHNVMLRDNFTNSTTVAILSLQVTLLPDTRLETFPFYEVSPAGKHVVQQLENTSWHPFCSAAATAAVDALLFSR